MSRMPLSSLSRVSILRAAAVVAITGLLWGLAACSDEDLVDTVPPPWPTSTVEGPVDGPQGVPASLLPEDIPTGVRTGLPGG